MRAFAFGGIVKKRFFGICLFLFVLTAAAGCGRTDGSVESSAAGEAGAAVQNMSAEAELQGEMLALTLHGYCVSEVNAADLQALGEPAGQESAGKDPEGPAGPESAGKDPEGPADLESAAKALEALRRAMEEDRPEQQYHAEDITVLLPTTEEDRKSGLTPRELAGTVHGWQDDEGEYHILVSAGNEIFWIRWGAGQTENAGPTENAGEAESAGKAKTAGEDDSARGGAALITGKWGD